jgi:hypothetical protein
LETLFLWRPASTPGLPFGVMELVPEVDLEVPAEDGEGPPGLDFMKPFRPTFTDKT